MRRKRTLRPQLDAPAGDAPRRRLHRPFAPAWRLPVADRAEHTDRALPHCLGRPRQQTDIALHLQRQAQRAEIRRALQGAHPPIAPERFVAVLQERSEGNFKYLDYVLADIEARERASIRYTWRSCRGAWTATTSTSGTALEALGKAEGWADWRDLYEPVLAFLAAAGEPVTALWLALQSRRHTDEVADRVLWRWQRFLRRERRGSDETWAIVHQSFADFLATKPDLAAAYKAIARYYLNFTNSWPDDDGYAFRHLSRHLARANMAAELGDLIENRAWYEAQRDHDPSLHAYAADVERAIAMAEERGWMACPRWQPGACCLPACAPAPRRCPSRRWRRWRCWAKASALCAMPPSSLIQAPERSLSPTWPAVLCPRRGTAGAPGVAAGAGGGGGHRRQGVGRRR